jgi:hypothetical protein
MIAMQRMSTPYGCCAKPIKNRASSISVLLPYLAITILSLLSILRDPAFVYVQTLIYIVIAVFGNRKWAVVGLIAVVYGSYSAPMDNELRFSGEYPSIHTMKILGPLKGIDVILAVLATISLKRFHYLIRKINEKNSLIFIGALFIGLFGTAVYQLPQQDSFDAQYALFITRGILFFLIATTALSGLSLNDLSDLINYAIFTCLILMFLSHLFPPQNVLSRELFGLNLNVVFAGDEYNSIGLLIAALLILNPRNQFKKAYVICFFALALALLAGRKAALLYFAIVVIMIFSESIKRNSNIKWLFQLEFLAPIVLLVVISNSSLDILKLAFIESLAILEPTIDSLVGVWSDNNFSGIIGIGPFSKYPLIGIDPLFDHPFSFGDQAGELYKIKLWFFPYERAFLNFGIVFGIVYLGFLIYQRKSRPAHFYIAGWLLYFFALNPVSSLGILSLALGYSAIQQMKKSQSVFTREPLQKSAPSSLN